MEKERIRYGEETNTFRGWSDHGDPCPECEVTQGQYHRNGCDIEECPICHHQLISCDCPPLYDGQPRKWRIKGNEDRGNVPDDFLSPLTELGEALAARWNEIEGSPKYSYDAGTATICSETGTGFDFMGYLKDILGVIPEEARKGSYNFRLIGM